MARPREFDRQAALDQAMQFFWTRGYEATTMTDLRNAIGIGRQSLYDTFGDKDQLFQEALAQYSRVNDADVATCLNKENGISGIRSFFEKRVRMLSSGTRRGCLMVNTCVELSSRDKAVALMIREGLATVQKGFKAALGGAVERGELSSNANVGNLAVFLTAQLGGMVVMAKNRASRKQLQAIADIALQTLK